jgi:hypothetical protein
VPDNKLESLMAELRAIDLWDRPREKVAQCYDIDRAGGLEARQMRRREIIDEIDARLKEQIEDSESAAEGMPLSTLQRRKVRKVEVFVYRHGQHS